MFKGHPHVLGRIPPHPHLLVCWERSEWVPANEPARRMSSFGYVQRSQMKLWELVMINDTKKCTINPSQKIWCQNAPGNKNRWKPTDETIKFGCRFLKRPTKTRSAPTPLQAAPVLRCQRWVAVLDSLSRSYDEQPSNKNKTHQVRSQGAYFFVVGAKFLLDIRNFGYIEALQKKTSSFLDSEDFQYLWYNQWEVQPFSPTWQHQWWELMHHRSLAATPGGSHLPVLGGPKLHVEADETTLEMSLNWRYIQHKFYSNCHLSKKNGTSFEVGVFLGKKPLFLFVFLMGIFTLSGSMPSGRLAHTGLKPSPTCRFPPAQVQLLMVQKSETTTWDVYETM